MSTSPKYSGQFFTLIALVSYMLVIAVPLSHYTYGPKAAKIRLAAGHCPPPPFFSVLMLKLRGVAEGTMLTEYAYSSRTTEAFKLMAKADCVLAHFLIVH